MVNALFAMVPKVLFRIGMQLLSEKVLEELILWSLEKLAKSSKTTIDDELFEIVKKALEEKKEKAS